MKRPWLWAALLAAAVVWIYQPAWNGAWLWDDPTEIANNALLREPAGLAKIWLGIGTPDYLPLKSTVQWVQWHLWGVNVLGYHATNIALHLMSSLLLWRLFRRLGAAPGAAYVGALMFAVHPVNVLSVAWVSELKNTLSLPLLLAAYLCYSRNSWRYAASWLLFAAALLAKTSVVMFPCVLVLDAWWRHGRIGGRDWQRAAPFFAASLAAGILTIVFQSNRVIATLPMPAESSVARLAGAGCAIWFYFLHALWPHPLLPIYLRWGLTPPGVWLIGAWLGVAAGLIVSSRTRAGIFVAGAFVLNVLPASGVLPMAFLRISRVSDHLAYVPMACLAGGLAALLTLLRSPALARTLAIGAAAAALALGLISRAYARHFTSEIALWSYEIAQHPQAWLAQNNLGIALAERGEIGPALPHLAAAAALRPSDFTAQMNLARALSQSGDLAAALPHFLAAHTLAPSNADAAVSARAACNNLGTAAARRGDLPAAISYFRRALGVDPLNAGVHRNLAYALRASGDVSAAAAEFAEADRLDHR